MCKKRSIVTSTTTVIALSSKVPHRGIVAYMSDIDVDHELK